MGEATTTGATRFELIDLERRIAERGLHLPEAPRVFGTDGLTVRPAMPPETLTAYETTLIRTALLVMAGLVR